MHDEVEDAVKFADESPKPVRPATACLIHCTPCCHMAAGCTHQIPGCDIACVLLMLAASGRVPDCERERSMQHAASAHRAKPWVRQLCGRTNNLSLIARHARPKLWGPARRRRGSCWRTCLQTPRASASPRTGATATSCQGSHPAPPQSPRFFETPAHCHVPGWLPGGCLTRWLGLGCYGCQAAGSPGRVPAHG